MLTELERVFECSLDECEKAVNLAGALLSAGVQKFTEPGVCKTDVNFLFVAYVMSRIIHLRKPEKPICFEEFVNIHHSWNFKPIQQIALSIDNPIQLENHLLKSVLTTNQINRSLPVSSGF